MGYGLKRVVGDEAGKAWWSHAKKGLRVLSQSGSDGEVKPKFGASAGGKCRYLLLECHVHLPLHFYKRPS